MTFTQFIPSSAQKYEEFFEGPEGIQLSTVAWGEPGAPHHVLCVHGGCQAKECFREQYSVLAEAGCYVVGFDLPWHGRSGPPSNQHDLLPTPHFFVESVEAVRNHFAMRDVTILAWSMGGLIVRSYLHRYHPPIHGLILVAPLLDFAEGMQASQRLRQKTAQHLGNEQEPFSLSPAAYLAFVKMLSEKEADYLTMGYNAQSFFSFAHLLEGLLPRFVSGEVETFLSGLPCPVMFVQGTKDMLVSAEYTRCNAARVPEEQVTLLELPCGHSPHLEQPFLFNAAVRQFLGSLSQGKTAPLMHPGGNGL